MAVEFENMADEAGIKEMYEALPSEVQGRVDRPRLQDVAWSREADGLLLTRLVYHLLPEYDRRLDPPYTVPEVAREFDISETAAREKLQTLTNKGILDKDETTAYRYTIASDLQMADESPVARPDGGMTAYGTPPVEPVTTGETHESSDATAEQYRLTDGYRERGDTLSLLDPSAGTPSVPIAASIALVMLGLVDASFPVAAGLTMSVTWLAYELAKFPNYTPRETLQSSQRIVS